MSRTDPLAGLNSRQRLAREIEDAKYMMRHAAVHADAADIEKAHAVEAVIPGALPTKVYDGTPMPIVCVRLDLDHPLLLADNVSAACVDCDCDLQLRPTAPDGDRLCICCAARRERDS